MLKFASLLCCALFFTGCSKVDEANKGKIISINPCTDAILLEIADAEQIGAISHYSHDKNASSVDMKQAQKFAAVGQSAEEIIALKPSLVLAGGHLSASTLEALHKLDIPVLQSPVANSIAESKAQISNIAAAINQGARGKALNSKIDLALESSMPNHNITKDEMIEAIVWQRGGLVPGENTLIDELLAHTGFTNVAHHYGLSQWDIIGLERLSATPPSIILRGGNGADRILQHPILNKIDSDVVDFPQSMIWCAGPTIIKAAKHLKQIHADYVKSAS